MGEMTENTKILLKDIERRGAQYVLQQLSEQKKVIRRDIRTIGVFFFGMQKGGTERVISLLIPIWKNQGYEIILFTDENPTKDDYDIDYTYVKRIVLTSEHVDEETWRMIRATELENYLLQYDVDIMIYNAWMSDVMLQDMLVTQAMGIPFLVYTHGVFSTVYHDRPDFMRVFPQLMQQCDGVVSLTAVSDEFYRSIGCRSFLITNPISKELYNLQITSKKSLNVLWIGRISREKRPLDAIDIFSRVLKVVPNAQLFIVGDGSKQILSAMQNKVVELAIEDSVHFEGFHTNVIKYYENARVMLMTSAFEGYSMTLLESKAHGVPCVMYSLPYLPLAKEERGLCVVKQQDMDMAAEWIIRVLKEEELANELSIQARESFEDLYSYDIGKRWSEILSDYSEKNVREENIKEIAVTKQMLSLLIEHYEKGTIEEIEKIKRSKEYVWGKKMLYLPRKVKRFMRKRISK